jgi:phage gp36-like protein
MFATKTDMVSRFGDKEVIQITDRDLNGVIDDAVLQRGLTSADAEISGYLAGRYALPFAVVPQMLVDYACDIARYRLTGTEVTCTPDIEARYHQAVKYLTLVGQGKISLGIDTAGAVVGGPVATGNSIRVQSGNRRFNYDSMTGY